MSLIERLDWDSEFFGFSVGRIKGNRFASEEDVSAVLLAAHEQSFRCLYFLAAADDPVTVALAERNSFTLADVRVVLDRPLPPRGAPGASPEARWVLGEAEAEDLPEMEDLAAQISDASRFAFDPGFGAGRAAAMYRIWIRKSMNGFADVVLVAREATHQRVCGLITCVQRRSTATIQLVGVQEGSRGLGVGRHLVSAALGWAAERGAVRMDVVTQARNVQALRTYEGCGFRVSSTMLHYHLWRQP